MIIRAARTGKFDNSIGGFWRVEIDSDDPEHPGILADRLTYEEAETIAKAVNAAVNIAIAFQPSVTDTI